MWGGLAVVAKTACTDLAGALVGVGWLVHAAWDAWYHRTGTVAPRGYALFDVGVGLTTLLAVLCR